MAYKKVFFIPVTPEDLINIVFVKSKGKILKFSINYRAKIKNEWRPIVRYDTAHDKWRFPHKHLYYVNKKPVINYLKQKNYNDLYTSAVKEIKKDWQKYKERYLTTR